MRRKDHWRAKAAMLAVVPLVAAGAVAGMAGPASAATCSTSADNGTCGPYAYAPPNANPGIPMSNGFNTYVVNQAVNVQPGTSNTLTATDPGNWNVVANETPCGGCVQTFVNSNQLMNDWNGSGWGSGSSDTPLSSLSSLKVNYSETTPRDGATVAEFAPDVWNDNYGDDVMFWADTQGRCNTGSYGDNVLGTAVLDGQTWTVNRFGGAGGEVIFVLDSNPAVPDSCAQQTSGTIDILAGYQWMVSNGFMTSIGSLSQLNTGWEICGASNATFTMSSYSITETLNGAAQPPAASTNAASGIGQTSATLNGTVNPQGQATSYHFEYGTSTAYGTSVPVPDGSAGSGVTSVAESASLTGLTAGTTYHYRLDATNATGTTLGSDVAFTTSPVPQAPAVVTQAATGVSASGATLNGTVNPEGAATTYQFEYGTSTAYGSVSPATAGSAGSGTSAAAESTGLAGLTAGTTYHYRLDATNATGTTHGGDLAFTTAPASSDSIFGSAVPATPDTADSNAVELGVKFTSDVPGQVTGIRFYKGAADNGGTHVGSLWTSAGTRLATGTFTGETASGWQTLTFANPVAITANTTYVASYFAPQGHYAGDNSYFAASGTDSPPLHALANTASPDGVYAYSASSAFPASSFSATNYYVDVQFSPQPAGQAPAVTTNAASGVTSTGATLNGSVNPEGQAATYQFDYGTTTAYGTSVPSPAGPAGSGTSAVSESSSLTGLAASTTYHYRVEATNATGTTFGADQAFTTAAAASLMLGDSAVEAVADDNAQGQAQAVQYTASKTGTSQTVSFYVDPSSTAAAGALGEYSNSGTDPGTLLKQVAFTPHSGWNTVTFTGVSEVSGTKYWLAELGTSGLLVFRDRGSGAYTPGSSSAALTSLPATWTTGSGKAWHSGLTSFYVSG